MKRSLFSRMLTGIFSMAAAACIVVVGAVYVAARMLKYLTLEAVELAGNKNAVARRAVIWFVWAKAFVCRLAKRQRPLVSSSWRMCPST
jgi:hypothetical protein